MNWIGGARARAKLKGQLNANSSRQKNPRNMAGDVVDEVDEDASIESDGSDDQNPGQRNKETSGGGDRGRKRKSVKKNADDDRIKAGVKNTIDYEALGYSLVKPQKFQRRVVPLLEFVEKKFPNGHVLGLHMSHVMDITRTPVNPCTSETN